MTIEIACTAAAAKAAQWLSESRFTLEIAGNMPLLRTEIERVLRAQSLKLCLDRLDMTAEFFGGPCCAVLRPHVTDWLLHDEMCRDGGGLEDFCAELLGLRSDVDQALAAFEDAQNYGTHRYAEERTGGAS